MRTLKIKASNSGGASPQHPLAKPGWVRNVLTYAITDVPDDIPLSEVIRLFSATVTPRDRYTIAWNELGIGRLIRS